MATKSKGRKHIYRRGAEKKAEKASRKGTAKRRANMSTVSQLAN
jgi:hypothetical protein